MLTMDVPVRRTLEDRIGELGQDVAALVEQVDHDQAAGISPTRRVELRARALELVGEVGRIRAELQTG